LVGLELRVQRRLPGGQTGLFEYSVALGPDGIPGGDRLGGEVLGQSRPFLPVLG
jgi:hypothetical protein